MAKVEGAYASVVKGVSEQVPQDRRPGQHYEQINMISDPVRGLARRHGSLMQDELVVAPYVEATHTKWLADTANHKVFPFFVDGVQYDLIYRAKADTQILGSTTFAFAFNKDARTVIPVVLGAGATMTTLVSGGVSSIVNVGKYLFIAGNDIIPTSVGVDKWDALSNRRKMAVWIRGGAYARNFSVTITHTNGTKLTKTYKTKSSSYPTPLDTSAILATDPIYQKKVNDAVNAYNGAVTAWIGEAAEDITPQNIAEKLRALFVADGISCTATIGTLCFDDANYEEVSAEDGGDGSLVKSVGGEVTTVDGVSLVHYSGKIIKVRPKKNNGTDALYLLAVPKDGNTGWGEVSWKECAGYEMTPTEPFAIGTVSGGTLYIAGNSADLATLVGEPVPLFKVNEVGDDLTSPLPHFINKRISYLGLFQDRLIIGSGAVLFFSRPGDYFNWFKFSVLGEDDRDPVEQYALGSEDDTIRSSTSYDKNLVLFGERNQYAINGRAQVSIKNPIYVMSSHESAVDAFPQSSGNFVFYAKAKDGVSSAHQIQIGALADSPESYTISQQLDRYIKGMTTEIVAVTAPNVLVYRTDAARNELYIYAYLDSPNGTERLFDSWNKWSWDSVVGSTIGLSKHKSDILVYMLREGLDKDGAHKVWFAAERFVMDTSISTRPYADSLRPTPAVLVPDANSFINPMTEITSKVYIAYGTDAGDKKFLGTDLEKVDEFLTQYADGATATWTGVHYDAFTTPTNPYIRDREGNAVVSGRLTLGSVKVSIADSGGLRVTVESAKGTTTPTNFTGRLLGRASNLIGQQPIVTTVVSAAIGREVRECKYTLRAQTFLPLTITAIEWVGQYFSNAKRV